MERTKIKLSKSFLAIARQAGKAIGDYKMIKKGDRILVAISGGKDSMLLWQMMKYFQRVAPVKFAIKPVFVDVGIPKFPVDELREFFKREGFPCRIAIAKELKVKSWDDIDCYVCSRNRRKIIFETAAKLQFNKVAMGHNLDDIAETILINLFYRGEIGAMRPSQKLFDGRFTIIRPLAYTRARDIAALVKSGEVRTFRGNKCPNDRDSQRMYIRRLLAGVEKINPAAQQNILNALRNVRREYLL